LAWRENLDVEAVEKSFDSLIDKETGEILPEISFPRRSIRGVSLPECGTKVLLRGHPQGHLLYLEGRLSSFLSQKAYEDRLVHPEELQDALPVVAEWAERLALPLPSSPPAVRRVDLASDLRMRIPGAGKVVLGTLGRVDVPRYTRANYSETGTSALNAVTWSNKSQGVAFRAYDKGVERVQAAPGEHLRFERQYRPECRDQQTVSQFTGSNLQKLFKGPLAGLPRTAVAVDSWPAADMHLRGLVGHARVDGRLLTDDRADHLLVDYMRLQEIGVSAFPEGPARLNRSRRQLRQLGLLPLIDKGTVDVSPVLQLAASPWRSA
jgi:hypothetical protein